MKVFGTCYIGNSRDWDYWEICPASKEYTNNQAAIHLRGMNMLFEGLKGKGSMIIASYFALETMNLGAMSELVSLANDN